MLVCPAEMGHNRSASHSSPAARAWTRAQNQHGFAKSDHNMGRFDSLVRLRSRRMIDPPSWVCRHLSVERWISVMLLLVCSDLLSNAEFLVRPHACITTP
eukprot:3516928-Amphidinium_carterae.1